MSHILAKIHQIFILHLPVFISARLLPSAPHTFKRAITITTSPLQEKSIISSDFVLNHHIPNMLTVFIMSELCNRRIQIQFQFKIQLRSVIPQPMTAIEWSHYHCWL